MIPVSFGDICILRYALLLDVLIDICFVFTIYLINLADTNRWYYLIQKKIHYDSQLCIFKSLIGTARPIILVSICRYEFNLSIYLSPCEPDVFITL